MKASLEARQPYWQEVLDWLAVPSPYDGVRVLEFTPIESANVNTR